jgi:hypothetical protein
VGQRRARLELRIDPGNGVDPQALAELTLQLRQELLQLDVATVELTSGGPPPEWAKGVDAAAAGSLVVGLAGPAGLLAKVVEAVQSWVARVGSRSVRMVLDGDTLEVNGISNREQRDLVKLWIDRHKGK